MLFRQFYIILSSLWLFVISSLQICVKHLQEILLFFKCLLSDSFRSTDEDVLGDGFFDGIEIHLVELPFARILNLVWRMLRTDVLAGLIIFESEMIW